MSIFNFTFCIAEAIAMSSHVTSGTFYVGNQYHFYMETHVHVLQ